MFLANLIIALRLGSNTSKHNIKKLVSPELSTTNRTWSQKVRSVFLKELNLKNWLPVRDKVCLNDAVTIFKCLNNLVPNYMAEKFSRRSQIHTRIEARDRVVSWTFRHAIDLSVNGPSFTEGQNGFGMASVIMLNLLIQSTCLKSILSNYFFPINNWICE